ncbi:DUF1573 domain-containing protein [Planctomycetota bacterium]
MMKCRYKTLISVGITCFLLGLIALSVQAKATKSTLLRNASGNEIKASSDTGSSGMIKFEKEVHDFGNIDPGSKSRCEFKFTNTGTGTLNITKVRTTCGCTAADLKKRKYAPGESGTLKITFSAPTRPGVISKRVIVSSNDKKNPRVTLTISGKVVAQIEHTPSRLNLLLKNENAGCPAITLKSMDNKPFAIKNFKSSSNCITADFDPSKKAKKFVIQPKVDIEKLKKLDRGDIYIDTGRSSYKRVTIPFSVMPEFSTKPPGLALLSVKPSETVTRELWVLNNYDDEFEIESILSEKGYAKVINQEKLEARYKIELQITPPPPTKTQKLFRDTIVVKTKGGEELKVACFGIYPRKEQ